MSKNKPQQTRKDISIIRSSAAEYLTFIAANGHGGVEAVYFEESVWITQKMMGGLYDVETHTINYHLKKVFGDSELAEDRVIRNFRIKPLTAKSTTPFITISPRLSPLATKSIQSARCNFANGPPKRPAYRHWHRAGAAGCFFGTTAKRRLLYLLG